MQRIMVILAAVIGLAGCGDALKSNMYLVSPHGGETWKLGTLEQISWSFSDGMGSCCHAVGIYVRFKDGQRADQLEKIATDRGESQNDGSFTWRAGTTLVGGSQIVLPAGLYTIRVCDDSSYDDYCAESGTVHITD